LLKCSLHQRYASVSRGLRRLTAMICLAGFLLANGGGAIAFAGWKVSHIEKSEPTGSSAKSSCCKRCLEKAKIQTVRSVDGQFEQQSLPQRDECPCCPQDGKNCPFPGGCTYCSVAKATCMPVVAVPVHVVSFSGERIVPASDRAFTSLIASLDRPPRA
jgi:hypothetical protein